MMNGPPAVTRTVFDYRMARGHNQTVESERPGRVTEHDITMYAMRYELFQALSGPIVESIMRSYLHRKNYEKRH